MGLDNLVIVLNDANGSVYLPGQEVSGTVNITNPSSKLLKGMYVECQGFGKFYYNELKNETFISAEKCYLNVKVSLIDIPDDGFELLKGSHQFPFSFTLPHNIPATYIAETHSKFDYGNVSYTIKAVLERNSRQNCGETCHNPFTNALKPAQKPNYEFSMPLTIKTLVDLNTIALAALPVESLKSKMDFGFCCCRTGFITVRIWLDKAGYVPGETIQLHAEVDNESRKALLGSIACLVENVDFHSHDKSKTYERVIVQEQGNCLKDPSQVIPIQLPQDLAPSYLEHCDIIDVSYKIEYTLYDAKRPDDKMGPFQLNIIIGNVPLRNSGANNSGNSANSKTE